MTEREPANNAENTANTAPAEDLIPAPTGQTREFVPERTHLFAIALMAMLCIIMAGWAPLLLGWTVIIPLLWIYMILRSKTTVGEAGISIRYAFRGGKKISWDNFDGIGFKGARTFASTTHGDKHTLPGVSFNSLPKLYDASLGRIPDALTEGKIAADDKVVVVHRDGQQLLLTKEEFAEHERANEAANEASASKSSQQPKRPHRGTQISPREN